MTKTKLLVIAGVLIVIGMVLFVMPTPGEPALECVPEGTPSSGFVDDDQGGCPVSQESYSEYSDWNSSPKLDNIAGLVLVLGGLGVGVTALVRGRRKHVEPAPTA